MSLPASSADPQPVADPAQVQGLLAIAIEHLNAGRRADALAAIATLDHTGAVGPVAATLLGLVALSAEAHVIALAWLDRALAADPGFVEALKGRATVLADSGRPAEADAAFDAAFRAGCVDPVAHYHHGHVLATLGRPDAALAAYGRALEITPAYPEALRAAALVLRDSGHPEEALRLLDAAVQLRPTYVEAVVDCANLLEVRDHQSDALALIDATLARLPGHAELLNNRGVVLLHIGRLADARNTFEAALAVDATLPAAHLNLGHIDVRWGDFEAGLRAFDRALALRPIYVEALCARGVALKLLGRFAEAAAAFEAALRHDPTSVYALTNRGELKLLQGDFTGGWPDYDKRFETRGHEAPTLGRGVPGWAGQSHAGKVALFADQAAGDIIQFARYIPVLRASGAEVTLICPPRLQRLLRAPSANCRVVAAVGDAEPFDFEVPLSNMPSVCRSNETTIPRAPYLLAEPDLVARMRERIGADGFKIGLCWRGSQKWQSDPKRSLPLAALAPLGDVPGVRLFSLQMADNLGTDAAALTTMQVETFAPDLDGGPDGFVETAALMANLDLVVSCDTSIAHLAGALGRPTFVLLQRVPEWRFMMERADTPWYPSMRLFRQVVQDDWSHPVAELVAAIVDLVPGD